MNQRWDGPHQNLTVRLQRMRSFTASETFAGVRLGEDESLDRAAITMAGEVAEDEVLQPDDRRAARGVLTGILLGAGAWSAIWFVVSALLHHRG